jgi:predicted O-methyltransferase YrrM
MKLWVSHAQTMELLDGLYADAAEQDRLARQADQQIYLASALRDNGQGKVITTGAIPEKSEQAKENLSAAAPEPCVEFRVGDAREMLKANLPDEIDLVFLEGAKGLYLEILKGLEPRLRPGALIASDDTDRAELAPSLEYVRTPGNGYASSALVTSEREHGRPHEISTRI